MTDTTLPVPIEEKHGNGCTCTEVSRIDLTLVAADRACPGDRNPARGAQIAAQLDDPEPITYAGRIAITWPKANHGFPLPSYQMRVHDYDTGEEFVTVTGLRMALGGDSWDGGPVFVDLTMLADADGTPLAAGKQVIPDENGIARRGVFRCYVAEMRIREDSPAAQAAA